MGLRGPNAQPLSHVSADPREAMPWEDPTLKRWQKVCAFLETLPITSGLLAGQTLKLLPFQRAFIKAVYSERRGKRLVRQAVLSCPRKNGKSGLSAGLALCHLLGPEAEQRGQVISCANDRGQASILYEEMKAIVERTPWMSDRIVLKEYQKMMRDERGSDSTGSTYQAVSAEVSSKHGLSPSCIIYDELGQSKSRELFDVMATSQGARKEPLLLVMSPQILYDNDCFGRSVKPAVTVRQSFFLQP